MHYIQKRILDKLRTKQAMHYAQLKDDEIESGHFRYHLGELVKEEYVTQLERGVYDLSQKGNSYVDKLSSHKINPENMPKVITYTLLNDGDTLLLQYKSKQPYIGMLNMIGGKLHENETANDASVREVYEKTGAHITSPKLTGVFEIIIRSNKELLTHAIAYVFKASVLSDDFDPRSITPVAIKHINEAVQLAPDFLPIFSKIATSTSLVVDTLQIEAWVFNKLRLTS